MSVGLDFELEPKKFRGLFVAFAVGALLLIWAAYALSTHFIRKNLEQGLQARLQRDVLLLEDHSSRALDAVIARLQSMAAFTSGQALRDERLSADRLRELIFETPVVRSLSLVNGLGQVVASSEPRNLNLLLPPDTLPAPEPGSAGSEVVLGRVLPYRDLDGIVAGRTESDVTLWLAVAPVQVERKPYQWVAVINTGYFQNFWARVDQERHDEIGLFDYRGQSLVAHQELVPDRFALAQALSRRLLDDTRGNFDLGEQQRWAVAYRGSAEHPVVLGIIADRERLLELQSDDARQRLLLTVLASLVVAVAVAWLYRWYLRYEASITELANQNRAIGAHLMVCESDPEGRIIHANQSFQRKTGYREDELIGQKHSVLSSDFHARDFYVRLWTSVKAGRIWKGVFRNRDKAGNHFWVNATIVPFTDAWGRVTRFVCLYSDITDAITLAEQLDQERRLRSELTSLNAELLTDANTDPLTGLSNLRGFERFARDALQAARHFACPMSLLMLDLDRFKAVNDGHGHAAGDGVLQEMARRWGQQIRSSDLLARLGGEEFCILLPNSNLSQAHEVAEKIRVITAASPVLLSCGGASLALDITVSIGIASADQPEGLDIRQLLQCADQALYSAKRGGRNRVVVAPCLTSGQDGPPAPGRA